jgi:DNA-binding response OmpR family regulator
MRPIVLIVEDEQAVLDLLGDMVTSFGYEVRRASTAAEALRLAEFDGPAAIILDVGLPDAGGTSVLAWLRQRHPDIPVVMLTGNADENLARDALRQGAFDYITKPFNVVELERALRAAVASRGTR